MTIPRMLQAKNMLPQTMLTSKLLPFFRYEKHTISQLTPAITYKYTDTLLKKNMTIHNTYAEHYNDSMKDIYPCTSIQTECFHHQKQIKVKESLYTSLHKFQNYDSIWYVSYIFTLGYETRFVQTQYITKDEMKKLYLHPPMNKETYDVVKSILDFSKDK